MHITQTQFDDLANYFGFDVNEARSYIGLPIPKRGRPAKSSSDSDLICINGVCNAVNDSEIEILKQTEKDMKQREKLAAKDLRDMEKKVMADLKEQNMLATKKQNELEKLAKQKIKEKELADKVKLKEKELADKVKLKEKELADKVKLKEKEAYEKLKQKKKEAYEKLRQKQKETDEKLRQKQKETDEKLRQKQKALSEKKLSTTRGPSGYNLYMAANCTKVNENLKSHLKKGEKLKPGAAVRVISQQWKSLSDNQRTVWNNKAK